MKKFLLTSVEAVASCLFLLICLPNGWANTVNVPKGGATIEVGPGGNSQQIKVKNTTGKTATDITITVYKDDNSAVPNIQTIDIENATDTFDDNDNGIKDPAETDNTDSSPGTTGRTITPSGTSDIKDGETVTVNIGFTGNLPPGAKLKVRFSTKDNANKHYDMCAASQLKGVGNTYNIHVPKGTHTVYTEAHNITVSNISGFMLQIPPSAGINFANILVAPPFQASTVNILGNQANIIPNPFIAPFEKMELYIQLSAPPMPATGAIITSVTMAQETQPNCIFPLITGAVAIPSALPPFFDVFTTIAFNPAPLHCKDFTFTNSTGQAASDFHTAITGTGGSLKATVIAAPPGCGDPKIPSNDKDLGNPCDIVWANACIPAGGSITIRFCTQNGPLGFGGGYWTNNGKNIGNINLADVADTGNDQGVPGNNYFVQIDDNVHTFLPDGSGLQTVKMSNAFIPEQPFDISVASSGGGLPCAATLPGNPLYNPIPCPSISGSPFPPSEYPRLTTKVNQPLIFTNGANPITNINITPPVMLNPAQAYLCGIHYHVSNYLSNWAVIFERQGNMGVAITYTNGTTERYIVEVATNNTNAGETDGACLGGTSTEVDCGTPDVVVVSGSLGFPHAWGEAGAECGDITEAAEAICAAYEANGNQPIHVTIDAHGSSGSIEIGGQTLTIDNIAAFAQAVAGKIASLNIFACSVAEGPEGEAFICALEEALGCNVVASTGVMSDLGEDPNAWFTEGEMVSWEPSSPPVITSVYPPMAYPGETVTIHGSGFDFGQPGSTIYLNSFFDIFYFEYAVWTNNRIVFTMPCSPIPPPPGSTAVPIQVIRPDGAASNFVPLDYLTPQKAFITNPAMERENVVQQIFWIHATAEGISNNYQQAAFYYRNSSGSPWNLIGVDTNGAAPAIGTVVPLGNTGNGWAIPWNPPPLPTAGAWKEIRVVFTDLCGNTVEDIKPVFCDPTPLKPLINYETSTLVGNRLFDDSFININLFVADENATLLTLIWLPLLWGWERELEDMGQQDSGIEDKEGDDASDMACGPVAGASCLRYFKDQFPGINGATIDSIAQLLACHANTDDVEGTKVRDLLKGILETLKGLNANPDGWTAEWHDVYSDPKSAMADMIKCMAVEGADVIPLFYQAVNCDTNGDGVINEDDYYGHYVTLSSTHLKTVNDTLRHFIDFMDPWTGDTQEFEVNNNTTPPELKGRISCFSGQDTCLTGNTYLRGFIKIKPPAAGDGGSPQQRIAQTSGFSDAALLSSSMNMPLSGPGNYTFTIPANAFESGQQTATLVTTDADGNQQSTNVLVFIGGCNEANFYYYQTGAPLTVQFTDVTQYNPNYLPDSWGWDFNNDNIIDATAQNPTHAFPAAGSYMVKFYVTSGNCTDMVALTVNVSSAPPPRLFAKAFLEGAYIGSGVMSNILLTENLLPKTQPYNRPPWNYNGNEGVAVLPPNTTDWVLAELRSSATPANIVAAKAGFLKTDGTLQDVDGNAGFTFPGVNTAQNYFVVLRHRNHLAVISSTTTPLNNSLAPYNFTLSATQVQGTNQMNLMPGGFYALSAGDFNADGVITVLDFNFYQAQAAMLNQYLDADCNLDKAVTVADFNLYKPNASKIGVSLIRY